MYEDYKNDKAIFDRTDEEKKVELLISVLNAKRDLDIANRNFEHAENELIDYYVYQIKALKSKLDFLMSSAKESGISLDMINEIYYRKNKVG